MTVNPNFVFRRDDAMFFPLEYLFLSLRVRNVDVAEFSDFFKAFDCVNNYETLIGKLLKYGFRCCAVVQLISFWKKADC